MRSAARSACALVVLVTCVAAVSGRAQAPRHAVHVIPDIVYHQGPEAEPLVHRLDLYLPAGAERAPALLYVHGGGFRAGSKEWFPEVGVTLAAEGIGVAAIDYRLSPDVKAPAHVEDAAAAFAWLADHATSHGLDPLSLFAAGHSAGASMVGLLATDRRYLGRYGLSPGDLRGVIAISGIMSFAAFHSDPGTEAVAELVLGGSMERELASPIAHVRPGVPPFLLLHAAGDRADVGFSNALMARAVRGAGGDAEVATVHGRDHRSILRRMTTPEDPAVAAIASFVRRHR